MPDGRGLAELLLEPIEADRVDVLEDLERDRLAVHAVVGSVDIPEAAAAERPSSSKRSWIHAAVLSTGRREAADESAASVLLLIVD